MEQTPKNLIQSQAPFKDLNSANFNDPYADVFLTLEEETEALVKAQAKKEEGEFLTNEETAFAISEARRIKQAYLNEIEYKKKLLAPVSYPTYTFEQLKEFVLRKATLSIENFKVNDFNRPVIDALCLYFSGDDRFNDITPTFSLSKGLLLYGNIGCGKTSLMRLFCDNQIQSYSVISCRKVASEFVSESYAAIDRYSNLIPCARLGFGQKSLGVCFDDLGTEDIKKNYGNDSSVMAEILLNRYDKHYELAGKTHLTTNLTTDDLKAVYGTRVTSRFNEMFNVIKFNTEAKDFRKPSSLNDEK